MSETDKVEKAKFLFDLFHETYEQVNASNRALDQKIHNMLALTSTLASGLLGLFYYLFTRVILRPTWMVSLFVILGIGMFLGATVLGIHLYRPQLFTIFGLEEFRQKYIEEDYLDVMKIAVSNLSDMTEQNRKVVMNKGERYKAMLWLVGAGIFFFLVGFVALAAN